MLLQALFQHAGSQTNCLPRLATGSVLRSSSRFLRQPINFPRSGIAQSARGKATKARTLSKPSVISKPPPKQPSIANSPSIPGPAAQYRSFADTLALRSSPTLLYQSPSTLVFTAASYAIGGFCFFWAGWNFYTTYLVPPEDLSKFLSIGIGTVCFGMACAGTWMILGVRPSDSDSHCRS